MSGGKQVSVAIIGAGFISEYHIDGIRAAGGADITTLVGRNLSKTKQRAEELQIAKASVDFDTVLQDPMIEGVVIATPDATHKPLAIAALDAGKCVLLQKPMAMNTGECGEIIAAAERSSARLSVSFMHRYFPEVRWLREQIDKKAFGKIHSVRMRNATSGAGWATWLYDPKNVAGGVVMQLGVHGIDLVQHLFGPIAAVSAYSSTMKPQCRLEDGEEVRMTLEDNVVAIYELAAGFNATHEMSWTEVSGTDRFRLEVYFEDGTVWLRTNEGAALFSKSRKHGPADWQSATLNQEPLGQSHHRHWLKVVRGSVPPDDTAQAGLSASIVAEHIYRSIVERRSQTVDCKG
ncbi:MAG: Gfo/Idh/MocA family oxidoreductase [Rhizobiaceae bacterium]|nr:Gfo/Idh/MocA family oxidoreductase [Rhizobiaceae bacterium]